MGGRQADQAIALCFVLTYAGSGLVMQCLARFHSVLSLARTWRIVSPLTRWGVSQVA
jgi:hypothetical protein